MKIDIFRLLFRLCCLGFILGRFKKRESKNGRSRGFVDVVFPLPASRWKKGNDFLWEPKKLAKGEMKKGDWVVFFGYYAPSGWKAKFVMKVY